MDHVILVLADVFELPFREIVQAAESTPAGTRKRASRVRSALGPLLEKDLLTMRGVKVQKAPLNRLFKLFLGEHVE